MPAYILATKACISYEWLLGKSDSNANGSIIHYPNKHKKLSNMAASPKDPIICIKNERNDRKGKLSAI